MLWLAEYQTSSVADEPHFACACVYANAVSNENTDSDAKSFRYFHSYPADIYSNCHANWSGTIYADQYSHPFSHRGFTDSRAAFGTIE